MGAMKGLGTSRMMRPRKSGGIGLSVSTEWFFDRQEVKRRLSPAMRRYLFKAGGKGRDIARRLIKKTGKARRAPRKWTRTGKLSKAWLRWLDEVRNRPASAPGSPIHTHTGMAREAILYGLQPTRESVVVGYSADVFDDIGELHEYGGSRGSARYPARPVMAPMLDKLRPKLPEFWHNAISK